MADNDESEVTKDMIASLAGVVLSESCGGPKRIASLASIDERNGRRWASGERSSPVYRTIDLLQRSDDPWPLVALFAATAARALLRNEGPFPEFRWRAEYIKACREEAPIDGHEDTVTVGVLTGTSTIRDQFEADRKVIATTMRRLALGYIGMTEGYTLNGPRAH